MTVFDSSALLAFLHDEPGSHQVEQRLESGRAISAANWSEIAQKTAVVPAAWPLARDLLLSFALTVEPVARADAEHAASLWQRGAGRSLADRRCLALAARRAEEVITADRAWAGLAGEILIR